MAAVSSGVLRQIWSVHVEGAVQEKGVIEMGSSSAPLGVIRDLQEWLRPILWVYSDLGREEGAFEEKGGNRDGSRGCTPCA